MESREIRKAVVWAVGALVLTRIHPGSAVAELAITVIAAIIGAIN